MKVGIVGLPNAGKSSLFNALTQAGAEAANYPFTTVEPNVAVVPVPDERLDAVVETVGATPTVYETIEFHDIAGLVRGAHKGEGLGNKFLANIRETDALVHVVRAHGDAVKVCDQLNEDAQKQLAAGGLGTKSKSCDEAFQKFLDEAEKAGGLNLTLKAKVTSVKVTGDKAVAKVRFGSKGRDGEIPLEKVDGEWKLQAAGASPSN